MTSSRWPNEVNEFPTYEKLRLKNYTGSKSPWGHLDPNPMFLPGSIEPIWLQQVVVPAASDLCLPSAKFCSRIWAACENLPSERAKGRRSVSDIFCTFPLAHVGLIQVCASFVAASLCSPAGCFLLGPALELRSTGGMHAAPTAPSMRPTRLPKLSRAVNGRPAHAT